MQLSIQQTAELLGKTRRQVVYLIQQGKLPARKVGGRWQIERADLKLDSAAQRRARTREARFRDAVEEALLPAGKERRYAMRDLRAVEIATAIYHELRERGADWEVASARLRDCLDHLAIGCHRFDWGEKTAAYRHARDAASLTAMDLWLRSRGDDDALLEAIEQELMPAFAGLLRRSERGGRR